MPGEDNALYENDLFLLTLKGWVTVHFMDGNTIEGEYATQDTLNIFLNIDGQPIMIPRSQIRYLEGERGQQIERDTSQQAFAPAQPEPMDDLDLRMPKTAEMPTPLESESRSPETETMEAEEFEEDGGTFVLTPESVDDLYPSTKESEREADDFEDTGLTFVLDDTSEPVAEVEETIVESAPSEDAEEATVLLDQDQEVTARLICTDGPHAGDTFELRAGVITVGRATDNDLPLPNDKEISRRHAIIARDMGKYMIQDQNSLNGTFVNEERIDGPHYLEDGDIILIGVTHIEYQEG